MALSPASLAPSGRCSRIRNWSATRKTPVLFLTGLGEDGMEDLYHVSGGDDFLTKPFSRLQLLTSVDRLLQR